ncbi:MAG TPA: molybdopterin-synthase adenylyltransferase MoeB [Gemmatimonadales bacterium]|jgi:adenylyltransferase/sulfurtransferase
MVTTAAPSLPGLSPEERQRYARHLALPEVGAEGQRRLKAARVLVVGLGGLGSPAALYLAAAGIGSIGLVDHDAVDLTNLQRQVLHGTSDVGRSKLASAVDRLRDLNPLVRLTTHDARLTAANALATLQGYDVVLDGSDNFPTRYLVNDACALLGIPDVYGSIHRFEGQVSVFWKGHGPCYRCLYRDPPPAELVPSCEAGGVLGVLPGIVGSLQAAETIKIVLGAGDPLIGRLLLFDALPMTFRELAIDADPSCPLCGAHPTIQSLIDYDAFCGAQSPKEPRSMELSPLELQSELAGAKPPTILDVREEWEFEIASIEGSTLIPLATIPGMIPELDPAGTYVTVCHKGARSIQAARFLKASGIADVRSLRGGIEAWAAEVDSGMERY